LRNNVNEIKNVDTISATNNTNSMFTGIIEETGTIAAIETRADGVSLVVSCNDVLEGTRIGDSITVNGVCLTVTSMSAGSFTADLLEETRNKTNLATVSAGSTVNLERSLTPVSRIGGHFVLGHVDATAKLARRYMHGGDTVMEIELVPELQPFVAPKGSIAIDGISLTVVNVTSGSFSVHLIPHTLKSTSLDRLKPGGLVNIEVDVLARYIYNFTQKKDAASSRVTESFLREQGFI
jgi:riboflavin synthase